MTDPTGEALDPREDEVRRLLADARHAEPVPLDVTARLDRVLEQLAAGGVDAPETVSELAVRRRRRAAGLLAAAAAVVAVGVGLGQVVPGATGGDAGSVDVATAGEAPASADDDRVAGLEAEESSVGAGSDEVQDETVPSEADALSDGAVLAESAPASDLAHPPGPPVRVRAERFTDDALRARHRLDGARASGRGDTGFECAGGGWGPGTAVAVLYEGRPHVLAFRAPAGDWQVVDLLRCGTGEILRSTTLPAA